MLSYRHAFHAGNHADVLKHAVLTHMLQYMTAKDAPCMYIDSHAGAGVYALDSGYATKLAEYQEGIARLWTRDDLPALISGYVELVRQLNPDGQLRLYPGSPWFAQTLLREQDKLRLFELHSSDYPLLARQCPPDGRRIQIQPSDGLAGLKALLPPPSRRALTLIDPSYEIKNDYRDVISALQEGLRRFATGTYALWYPQLARPESRQLVDKLKALPLRHWLHVSLTVGTPPDRDAGMTGSGLFIINPPWTLAAALEDSLPWLVRALGQSADAHYHLEHVEAKPGT
ncbi:MAG: 23S rRNA (adenine(2030)-N(6))-methyltransferase RlmJ [Sterolibacterium sp.]|jgi:23S rRNA (adenine2030-N6)-methyltransferase|nr:23S rRNA (adenine(2030)-N(6))-methyltransferase RlmJ [Sterolibacterium sp.]